MNSITYRGPSLTTLHEEYAKRGRIDDHAPIRARRAIVIDAPAEDVWRALTDLAHWSETLEPDATNVAAPAGIAPGAPFTRTIGRADVRARFAVVDEPRELAWTGSAFGANVVHRFALEDAGEGRTRVLAEESMAGRFLGAFFGIDELASALEESLRRLKRGVEARRAEPDTSVVGS